MEVATKGGGGERTPPCGYILAGISTELEERILGQGRVAYIFGGIVNELIGRKRPAPDGPQSPQHQQQQQQPDPKRRKIQKSVQDLKEQTAGRGFSPDDLQLFDQPHYKLASVVKRSSEVEALCELGSETEWWATNSRKMSASNVMDKLAHRVDDEVSQPRLEKLPVPTTEDSSDEDDSAESGLDDDFLFGESSCEDEEEEEDEEEVDEDDDGEDPSTVNIATQGSKLYSESPASQWSNAAQEAQARKKREAQTAKRLAKQDVNATIVSLLNPGEAKMNIFTRHLLSNTQPRRNHKIRVVMQDLKDGSTRQITRSVPYFLDSLNDIQQGKWNQVVHLHTRKWEEAWLLRTPIIEWGERACVNGLQCQGYAACFSKKGVAREYVSPQEHAQWMSFGKWPHLAMPQRQCLMCKRYAASKGYWSSRAARRSANPANFLLVEFYNLVNVPGEYAINQCIWNQGPYMGLWGPVAEHHLPNYFARETTLGDLLGRGILSASPAFQAPCAEALMQQISITRFEQRGFVQVSPEMCEETRQKQLFCRGLRQ